MKQRELFYLCASIASGATGLKEMPRIAAPQQLLSVLGRLASLTGKEFNDEFLNAVAKNINEKRLGSGEDALYEFLEELAIRFAKEARSRTGQLDS
jgi:hypothetical protein